MSLAATPTLFSTFFLAKKKKNIVAATKVAANEWLLAATKKVAAIWQLRRTISNHQIAATLSPLFDNSGNFVVISSDFGSPLKTIFFVVDETIHLLRGSGNELT
jgi:hypothetical protein